MNHDDKEIDDEQQQEQKQEKKKQDDDDDDDDDGEKLADDDDDDDDDDNDDDDDQDDNDDDVDDVNDDDNIKVAAVGDEDENIFLSSSDENDDDIDDNNLLDFLMTYNKLKHKNKQKKEGKFLPILKNFLKASIEHKKEMYERNEKRLTARFRYVAKNILDKNILIDLTRSEKHVLQKLVNNKYKKFDRKILFIENFHLHSVFERAVCLLKKEEQKIKR